VPLFFRLLTRSRTRRATETQQKAADPAE